MKPLITLDDYEQRARDLLPAPHFDYYAGGSGEERTLRANRDAFDRFWLRPGMLAHPCPLEMGTSVLGSPINLPVLLAPTAYMQLAHPAGETAAVQAAGDAGILAVLSINASQSLEESGLAAGGPLWQQMYLYPDRAYSRDLIARIEAAGYRALVLTVDRPVYGRRERELRHQFTLPPEVQAANFAGSRVAPRTAACVTTWDEVAWVRSITTLPVVLKGIMTAEDAREATRHDIAGVIVSNHGGRQLDGARASIEALPEVVAAAQGHYEVYVDGGIRRGIHVLVALALGARAVLVGRPILWGLAVNGREGVKAVLNLLREELALAMQLAGRPSLASIDRSVLV